MNNSNCNFKIKFKKKKPKNKQRTYHVKLVSGKHDKTCGLVISLNTQILQSVLIQNNVTA